ncbi:MAG: Gfo/Idh/MocA family oxidoreductase [Anaerolineae bacterium]|nr:Gfo/Idh/MocA family oxidoreductase [Anaerolineae bacterium]
MAETSRKARIGIIGTGWWATEAHLPAIKAHEDGEVVAICDTRPERLNLAAETFDITNLYSDYHEILARETMDGIIVVTPHATHYDITRDCLEQGLHVLLEKPMTLYAKHARALVELAEKNRRELIIGYPYHYYPPIKKAREVIQGGELGPVQYVTSSFSTNVFNFLNGGVAPDASPTSYKVQGPSEDYNSPELLGGGEGHLQITHSAAMMFFITGLRAKKVHALMHNHGLNVDLIDTMTVEFEDDALGMVGGTGNAGKNYRLAMSIYCEQGCLVTDTMARIGVIRRPDGSEEELFKRPEHPRGEGRSRERRDYPTTRNFIEVILGREENGSPAEVGWRTVELLDAAYRSANADGNGVYISDLYTQG